MRDHSERTDVGAESLADRRRRRTLSVLADAEPPMDLGELAAAVTEAAAGGGPGAGAGPATDGGTTLADGVTATAGVDGDRERRIAIRLYHVHLPKLDDDGVISFDPDARAVVDW